MKKFLMFFIILMLLPKVCFATSITSFSITRPESANSGDKINLNVSINFSDLDKNSASTQGIITIGYSFKMDEKIFELISITSDSKGLDTEYEKTGDYYTILATLNENDIDRCLDGISFCNNYKGTITLKVKDTKEKSTTISYNEATAGVMEVSKILELENSESEEELIDNLIANLNIIKQQKSSPLWYIGDIKLNVKQEDTNKSEDNKTTTDNNNSNSSENNNSTSTPTTDKENNNIIKDFVIKDHIFHFNPEQKNYDLEVDENTNSLDIIINLNDDEAKYEIIGADNLKEHNNEVLINVTTKNGDVNTYKINVMHNNNENEAVQNNEKKLKKEQIIMGSIGLGIMLISFILLCILIHLKNKKEDKKFDF